VKVKVTKDKSQILNTVRQGATVRLGAMVIGRKGGGVKVSEERGGVVERGDIVQELLIIDLIVTFQVVYQEVQGENEETMRDQLVDADVAILRRIRSIIKENLKER